MRNESFPLSTADLAVVAGLSERIFDAVETGQPQTVNYVKRDGTGGTATGPLVFVNGQDSTLAVTIDSKATKGRPTTVNVRLITFMGDAP